MEKDYSDAQSEGNVVDISNEYSNVESTGKLALFTVLTTGLYFIYWSYRNWSQLKAHKNLDINPALRTVGLFIPLVNIYFTGTLIRDIRDYANEAGIKTFSLGLVLGMWVIFFYLGNRLAFYSNPLTALISWVLIICLIIPYSMVQDTLNEYWIKEQGDSLPKKGLTGGEIAVLIIGIILTVFEWIGIVGLFMGI